MSNTVEFVPNKPRSGSRLRVGQAFVPCELPTLAGTSACIPDARRLVHLQMRRYAGCPICSLHLRSFTRRREELELLKYGVHADDQWSIDEVLSLAQGREVQ